MRWLLAHRPSPSMVVALTALVVALGGTAMATTRLVDGDKLIAKASLSGNRLRDSTITATQLNLKRLGEVPSAAEAQTAASATTAISATTAASLDQVTYRSSSFVVLANYGRTTGEADCDPGTFAVGGGTTSPEETEGATDLLVDSHPTSNRAGWQATVENDSSASLTETVWAVCIPAISTG